ncbi:NAD(P)H-binding protein [Actinokineospora globicatena]|uniref:NAD(P)H-binding protein n=1 Tax=Actinokineospora globicatena TaxID=103729 RepID=UPI0020A45915|nr:NAD(P)H-binding protein [Actinokineospora globicatena]MCP2305869.1 Uncharacterized conserved protein YbjT, contains NAD(P)-binding and DUF2867 domains [Actinokineospora globicatena]GLW80262.1 NmrA family transcriptional regulator [Actinokineospora globicatena]GLW87091.1 NmrA family transcriptional regulator [Actinokineospora globicatena]
MSILVIGSTGKTGVRVLRGLERRGVAATGVARGTTPRFDWTEPDTWAPALAGASAVYITYAPDLAAKSAPAAIERLTELATAAGVERLVLLSGRGEHNAGVCEEIVRASTVDTTIVRASWFAQNFSEGALRDSVLDGVFALPAGDLAEPLVDVDDIADVVVAALTEDGHAGKVYEVTGPRLLTFAEAAAEISAASGREVRYLPVTLEQFNTALVEAVGPEYAEIVTALCAEVFDGRNASVTHGVREALGREPRDFSEFCAAAFRSQP